MRKLMAKKQVSSDPDALRRWLEKNKDADKVEVNGVLVPIVASDSTELSGHVNADDYNQALKLSAPWGCKKTGIGAYGIFLLALNPSIDVVDIRSTPTYSAKDDNSRLFRCTIPGGTLEILKGFNRTYNLNRSQLCTLVLRSFGNNDKIQQIYQDWREEWCQKTGLTPEQVDDIVFSFFRIDGTLKRYNLAKVGDPEAGAEKLT